jgi:hypothetical protein
MLDQPTHFLRQLFIKTGKLCEALLGRVRAFRTFKPNGFR